MNTSERALGFERRFQADPDPWSYTGSWYEARKRALAMATLSRPRYGRAFEPGCANGVLSRELAARCDALLCADVAASAVALARARLADLAHVQVAQYEVPVQWPSGRFDLLVFSEFLCYLREDELDALVARARAALAPDGEVLCCHWRGAQDGWPVPVARIHARFGEASLHGIASHVEREFLLDLWSIEPASVAQREGLA